MYSNVEAEQKKIHKQNEKHGEIMEEKLTLEEYKTFGEAIKSAYKNLRLIEKLLSRAGLDVPANTTTGFVEQISTMVCDLANLSCKLEDKMDTEHPDKIVETIEYFN